MGQIPHSLKMIKIEVMGRDWFQAYSTTILSPCSTSNASRAHLSGGALAFLSGRAFIKALFNIRGVERVEISGPMQAELKKRLTVAMTTRPGRRVREWQNGGGLRTDDDIAWGTWAAAMQPVDEREAYAATAYELNPFPSQAFVAHQPMQIAALASFEPNRLPSFTSLGPLDRIARPTLPMVDDTTRHDSLASSEKQPKVEDDMKMEDADDLGTQTVHLSASKNNGETARRSDVGGKSNDGKGDAEMQDWAGDGDGAAPSDDMNDDDYDDAKN